MTTDDTISAVARHLHAGTAHPVHHRGRHFGRFRAADLSWRWVGCTTRSDGGGLRIEEVLSGEVFALRPDLTWKYPDPDRGELPGHSRMPHIGRLRCSAGISSGSWCSPERRWPAPGCGQCGHHRDPRQSPGLIKPSATTKKPADDMSGGKFRRAARPVAACCGRKSCSSARPAGRRAGALHHGPAGGLRHRWFQHRHFQCLSRIVQPVVYAASAGIPTVEINPARTS